MLLLSATPERERPGRPLPPVASAISHQIKVLCTRDSSSRSATAGARLPRRHTRCRRFVDELRGFMTTCCSGKALLLAERRIRAMSQNTFHVSLYVDTSRRRRALPEDPRHRAGQGGHDYAQVRVATRPSSFAEPRRRARHPLAPGHRYPGHGRRREPRPSARRTKGSTSCASRTPSAATQGRKFWVEDPTACAGRCTPSWKTSRHRPRRPGAPRVRGQGA